MYTYVNNVSQKRSEKYSLISQGLLDLLNIFLLSSNVPSPPPSSFTCLRHRHHRIILPPGCPPSPSQHTKNLSLSLLSPLTTQDRPPLPFPSPHHACQIPIAAAPLLLPKYFSMWPPVADPQPPASTTA